MSTLNAVEERKKRESQSDFSVSNRGKQIARDCLYSWRVKNVFEIMNMKDLEVETLERCTRRLSEEDSDGILDKWSIENYYAFLARVEHGRPVTPEEVIDEFKNSGEYRCEVSRLTTDKRTKEQAEELIVSEFKKNFFAQYNAYLSLHKIK